MPRNQFNFRVSDLEHARNHRFLIRPHIRTAQAIIPAEGEYSGIYRDSKNGIAVIKRNNPGPRGPERQNLASTKNSCRYMEVSLNYCSRNGGNLYRAPYYNGNPNIGPRIIGNLDQYPFTKPWAWRSETYLESQLPIISVNFPLISYYFGLK